MYVCWQSASCFLITALIFALVIAINFYSKLMLIINDIQFFGASNASIPLSTIKYFIYLIFTVAFSVQSPSFGFHTWALAFSILSAISKTTKYECVVQKCPIQSLKLTFSRLKIGGIFNPSLVALLIVRSVLNIY